MTTLLPYISSQSGAFSLRLLPGSDQLRFPFVVISDSGAFTRILKAEITSDNGSIITPVFLLMGKDGYTLTGTEQELLNNEGIDQCWQRAYRCFSEDEGMITLTAQAGDDSGLRQLQPLFFCRETGSFFHPLCPKCGKPLILCKDDDLLDSVGLRPYTKTLSRYLYCRDCHQNKRRVDFYSYEPVATDPQFVKDLHHLIDGFGSLKQTDDKDFPCLKCPLQGECYSDKMLAQERIVPFSFYPFHLFVLRSANINALDFLALISGAALEDIRARMDRKSQHSRLMFVESATEEAAQSSPLLFKDDSRYFLELLYLKLSFLGQLAQIVFSNAETLAYPDLATTLDRIWVDLPGSGSLLPYFWNFQARFIDIGPIGMSDTYLPKMPPSYASYLMGTLWFQTLLSNARHSPEEINAALTKHLFRTDALSTRVDEDTGMEDHSHLFSAENIFWNPGETELSTEWTDLWAEALGIGWALLKSSATGEFSLSENDFREVFDKLRQDIRDSLFMPAETAEPKQQDVSNDSAIHAILLNITDKWSRPSQEIPEEMEETVIISGKQAESPAQNSVEETVVLKPGKTAAPLHQEEDVLETVILSADDVATVHTTGIEPEVPETVIIKPSQMDQHIPDEPVQKDSSFRDTEDDLEATVILKDETIITKPHSQQPQAENRGDDEDLLEETIIIGPDKDKD